MGDWGVSLLAGATFTAVSAAAASFFILLLCLTRAHSGNFRQPLVCSVRFALFPPVFIQIFSSLYQRFLILFHHRNLSSLPIRHTPPPPARPLSACIPIIVGTVQPHLSFILCPASPGRPAQALVALGSAGGGGWGGWLPVAVNLSAAAGKFVEALFMQEV